MAIAKEIRTIPIAQSALLFVLLGLLIFGAGPGYLRGGQWVWQKLPDVPQISILRQMREKGLPLPGWQILEQGKVRVGGETWSLQLMEAEASPTPGTKSVQEPAQETAPAKAQETAQEKEQQAAQEQGQQAIVMLRPQVDARSQPQVEWTDIKGFHRWTEDSERDAKFTASGAVVKARFFRGWSQEKGTFAILEWYAWPGGGSPAPTDWFWKDRAAQWQRQRLPWSAVTIMVPMEPLGDVEKTWPLMEQLGVTVQQTLDQQLD